MEHLNEDELIRDYLEGIPKEDLLAKHGVTRSQLNLVRKKHNIAVRRNAVARYRKNIEAVGTVTCQICGLHFQSLLSHVKARGLTVDEYVACYDHVLNIAAVKEKMSASAKRKFDL